MKIYTADFETMEIEKDKVAVYMWAMVEVGKLSREDVIIGNDMDSFFKKLSRLSQHNAPIIYFYNLKFDGVFIIDYLFRNGYKLDKENVKPKKKNTFTEIIDTKGIIYQIAVKINYNIVYFRCAYRLALVKLKKLAEDYKTKYQKLDTNYYTTDNKVEYIQNDVLIVSEFLSKYFKMFKKPKLTIGSQALSEWKKMSPKWWKKTSKIDIIVDNFMRKSYKGGIIFLKEKYKNKLVKDVYIYDINSSYPYMMHSTSGNYYPACNPYFFREESLQEVIDKKYLFIIQFECKFKLKKNGVPCISGLGATFFSHDGWQVNSEILQELTLCNVDYQLFIENYDFTDFHFIKGFFFEKKIKGYADKFVNKYYKIKSETKGAERNFAKMMLNNLSGKFGQKQINDKKFIDFNEKKGTLFSEFEEQYTRGIYLPYIIFTTAYARQYLISAIKNNYENFIYCDTDSIHLTAPAKGIKVGTKLGQWKLENHCEKVKYLKSKAYVLKDVNGSYDIRISGMPKEYIKNYTTDKIFNDFKIGAVFTGAKLVPKLVKGGIKLIEDSYTIQ